MIRWMMLWIALAAVAPVAVYASDESEGVISAAEVEAEEAAHEQVEALRLRAGEEKEIAEIQAEAKREEEKSKAEFQAAEGKFKDKSESKSTHRHASESDAPVTVKSEDSR